MGCRASKEDPTEKVVFVLTSNSFQKWLLAQGDPDRMFYNCDLENIGKQAFATHMWVSQNQYKGNNYSYRGTTWMQGG